jgi:hypothetical protein
MSRHRPIIPQSPKSSVRRSASVRDDGMADGGGKKGPPPGVSRFPVVSLLK